jgi:4-hydroxy-3-methylbut-2-en-1-yl diphosphate reductase
MDTEGNHYFEWAEITKEDIALIPAFGTTIEIENKLNEMGIQTKNYDTTCPFVEKVWNRANDLGGKQYTVIIHGKHNHEETRATFSHSIQNAKSVIVRDIKETETLSKIISGELPTEEFYKAFNGKFSEGFDVDKDLEKVGVVNQTTMLASETQQIADLLKQVMINKYGEDDILNHFADTRDTLCYATNDNQSATYGLMETEADLAIVVGGYNSSNTSHIVELLEDKFPTYFINNADKILSKKSISHFDVHKQAETITENYLPTKEPVKIVLTSGASCPDAYVDEVLNRVLSFYNNTKAVEDVIESLEGE